MTAEALEEAADEWPNAYASSVSDYLHDRAAALQADLPSEDAR